MQDYLEQYIKMTCAKLYHNLDGRDRLVGEGILCHHQMKWKIQMTYCNYYNNCPPAHANQAGLFSLSDVEN